MKIGIIVAMDKELQQLQRLFNDGNVIVQKCGIGKVNAALGAADMISQYKPDVIISSGCAGGGVFVFCSVSSCSPPFLV